MLRKTVLCVSVLALAGIGAALAQQPPAGIKRTPLQTVSFPEGYNTVTGLAELAPGTKAGRHTHPGIETPVPMRGPRGPFGIPLPLMPGPKTLCELRAGT